MMQTYRGSCHCGAVRFEADLDLDQNSYRCNCSICRRTRFWPAVARADGFRLLAGQEALTEYRFNTHKNQHFFCRHCGVRAFGVGNETPIDQMYGVNIGCLEGLSEEQLSRIPITHVDGQHDRWDAAPVFTAHL
ncbi:GFA family protein [Hydrogenophaga sp. OTU3427]|uniref:GFA family protein n=1 Tax=Hydrogenophaga sp. OTU3427 TaxID=3043856 RepID=UPI00313B846D